MKLRVNTEGEKIFHLDPEEEAEYNLAAETGDLANFMDYYASKAHGEAESTFYVDGVEINVYG